MYLIGDPSPDVQELPEELLAHTCHPTLTDLIRVLRGVNPTPQTLDPRLL